jgi:hypothetical protein
LKALSTFAVTQITVGLPALVTAATQATITPETSDANGKTPFAPLSGFFEIVVYQKPNTQGVASQKVTAPIPVSASSAAIL